MTLSNQARNEILHSLRDHLPTGTRASFARATKEHPSTVQIGARIPPQGARADLYYQVQLWRNAHPQLIRGHSLDWSLSYTCNGLNILCTCKRCALEWGKALSDEDASQVLNDRGRLEAGDYPITRRPTLCKPCSKEERAEAIAKREAVAEARLGKPTRALSAGGFQARMRDRRKS